MVTPRILIVVDRLPGMGEGLRAHLSPFAEEHSFRVFCRIYLQIIDPRPRLNVGQLCLSTAGVFSWYYNVRVISELDQVIARRRWVEVSRVYDVCRRTDARTLDYASGYLTLVLRAVCVCPLKKSTRKL